MPARFRYGWLSLNFCCIYLAFNTSSRRFTEGFVKCFRRRISLVTPISRCLRLYLLSALSMDSLSLTLIMIID